MLSRPLVASSEYRVSLGSGASRKFGDYSRIGNTKIADQVRDAGGAFALIPELDDTRRPEMITQIIRKQFFRVTDVRAIG